MLDRLMGWSVFPNVKRIMGKFMDDSDLLNRTKTQRSASLGRQLLTVRSEASRPKIISWTSNGRSPKPMGGTILAVRSL